ncbi:MAG TPA: tetratricopeptide repeat protein [Candidatus Aquilonibacter sp.]|jgi:tetratricopeptide (TPR) repeat protein|nr:tetratricopeptide repeat protein [Candidatus Aquilonibacter sp.]
MRYHSSLLSIFILVFSLTAISWAKQDAWIEVTTPHFVVVTNANEKQGRRAADQFERMRAVFHTAFPKLKLDPGSPIIVLAIKDEKDFRALEPEAYLAKGSLKLGGLFLRAADKNYVLMRLDAEGDHPYSVIYHEYTHLLMSKSAEWIPLWMNEGLAEFYQNTDIREKEVSLGEASPENILLLRQSKLLPLATLFTIDEKSPYYHEENKGSIFYAESWALMHYIQTKDFKEKTNRLAEYANLLTQNVDPVTAATRTFGDLNRLYSSLEGYVRQGSFSYLKMNSATDVDDSTFKLESLSPPQTDAIRADFLAYNNRTADAQALLDQALQADPKNVSAHETMGFLAFRQGQLDEAKKWYAQAVQLDSKSFLAHYYYAAITMNSTPTGPDDSQIEKSLRTSIQLNPSFAPSFDRLAVFLAMRQRDLDEAHRMGLMAVALDPANIGYRINVANILVAMGQGKNAVNVARETAKLAKTPAENQAAQNELVRVLQYADYQERVGGRTQEIKDETSASQIEVTSSVVAPRPLLQKQFVPSGPHHFLVGVLKNVRCADSGMDLTVASGEKILPLRSDNYYKIEFTALNVQLRGDLKPCTDLENRPAKVEYVDSADKSDIPHLIAVEIHK